MATLINIEKEIAGLMNLAVADFTPSGLTSLSLAGLNRARRRAELAHDFEFSRKLVQVSVNGATGGSLVSAVLHSDGTTSVDIKSVIEVGVFDEDNNLRPVEWTTVAEGIERQRKDNRQSLAWYSRDDGTRANVRGSARFEFAGTTVFAWPKEPVPTTTYLLGLEVYAMAADWSAIDSTNDEWCKYGTEYLTWATIEYLNHRFKTFVARTEGNLPPPSQLAAQALDAFIQWDSNMYEQFRRHSR